MVANIGLIVYIYFGLLQYVKRKQLSIYVGANYLSLMVYQAAAYFIYNNNVSLRKVMISEIVFNSIFLSLNVACIMLAVFIEKRNKNKYR